MSINKRDARLSEEAEAACKNAEKLDLDAPAATVRDEVVAYARDRFDHFRKTVGDEDRAETQLSRAIAGLDRAEDRAARAFQAMHTGLKTGVVFAMDDQATNAEKIAELSNYLDAMSPSDFRRLSQAETLTQFERTHSHLSAFLPDELESRIQPMADAALAELKAQAEARKDANAEWLVEQADLQAARNEAREAYLALRDGISAALRMAGMHERLNQIVKPLERALSAGGSSGGEEPVAPADPAPEEDEEPVA